MPDRAVLRALAAEHIRELGLKDPPFDHEASLRARRLTLIDEPLELILAGSNLPLEARDKIDGFVDLEERVICLAGGLHPHQHRFGLRHEIGHDLIPWQRELLHYCPFHSLPPELQHEFEREASMLAAELAFFADQWVERIASHSRDLRSVMLLADHHDASYESTARHYVECSPYPCFLVISKRCDDPASVTFETAQYIRSPHTNFAIQPGQRFDMEPDLLQPSPLSASPMVGDHELVLPGAYAARTYRAQSFWNGYKLFTLVWP